MQTKLGRTQMPLVAITDTFSVASQAAMLALSAETGDIVVRTDLSKSYILRGLDPTLLANWQEILTPSNGLTPGACVSVRKTATQVLTTTSSLFAFDVVEVATDTATCDINVATTGLVALKAGVYLVMFSCDDLNTSTTTSDTMRFAKNGVAQTQGSTTYQSANKRVGVNSYAYLVLDAGDTVSVAGQKNASAGTATIYNLVFSMQRVDAVQGPTGAAGGDYTTRFTAAQLDNPVSADWAVNNLAPAGILSNNTAITVRFFDDTEEEGVGGLVEVPLLTTDLSLGLKIRAVSAQASVRSAVFKLYCRRIRDGSTVTAWTNVTFTASLDTTTNFKYYTFSTPLSSLGIVAGELVQFELTRNGASASDTVIGDVALVQMYLGFN